MANIRSHTVVHVSEAMSERGHERSEWTIRYVNEPMNQQMHRQTIVVLLLNTSRRVVLFALSSLSLKGCKFSSFIGS